MVEARVPEHESLWVDADGEHYEFDAREWMPGRPWYLCDRGYYGYDELAWPIRPLIPGEPVGREAFPDV